MLRTRAWAGVSLTVVHGSGDICWARPGWCGNGRRQHRQLNWFSKLWPPLCKLCLFFSSLCTLIGDFYTFIIMSISMWYSLSASICHLMNQPADPKTRLRQDLTLLHTKPTVCMVLVIKGLVRGKDINPAHYQTIIWNSQPVIIKFKSTGVYPGNTNSTLALFCCTSSAWYNWSSIRKVTCYWCPHPTHKMRGHESLGLQKSWHLRFANWNMNLTQYQHGGAES